MANEIELYKKNSKTVLATITGLDSLSDYVPVLTVKDKFGDADLISVTGTTEGLTLTFEFTPTQTDLDADNYKFDVTLSNGVKNYTTIQSTITVLDSVKWT